MSASDMSMPLELTPQERLASSRKAIIRHMTRGDDGSQKYAPDGSHHDNDGATDRAGSGGCHGDSNWNVIKNTARAWWHHHPANVAFDVAKPVVESYTRNHPLKVLGIAAGLGAAAVWIKPWRLVSIGGLAALAMRSTNISGAVFSMLTSWRTPSSAARTCDGSNSDKYQINKDIP
jgi:hypothetical protein